MTGLLDIAPFLLKQEQGAGGGLMSMLPMLLIMFAIFYFILIRPQARERKAQQAMRESLRKGDEVLTQGGIVGKVHQTKEQYVILEVEGSTRLRVVREAVVRRLNEGSESKKESSRDASATSAAS